MRKGDLPQGTQRAQRDRLRHLTGGNRAHGGFEQQNNEGTKFYRQICGPHEKR